MGKNHIRVNGRLLQTNKKYSHLKMKQKEWLALTIREKCIAILESKKKRLTKADKEEILFSVSSEINERGMWLPPHEIKRSVQVK